MNGRPPLDRNALAQKIAEMCWVDGTFRLRSGRTESRYFDKMMMSADPTILRQVARAMAPLVPDSADVLAGLELGAIPVVTMLADVVGRPARFVRKERKSYGTEEQVEGGLVAGVNVLVVEDVVTTGGAVLDAVAVLRDAGAHVTHALCVADRAQGGTDALAAEGVALLSLYTLAQLTP